MKTKRAITALALLLAACLGLTACSTTLGENASIYFSEVGERLTILSSGNTADDSDSDAESSEETSDEEEDENKTALASPEDFTISEDGTYSFSAVENADYYVVYLYDTALGDDASYSYMSDNIAEDGSDTYTGSIIESASPAYGVYRVEVVAYPSVTSSEYKKSEASTGDLTVSGEVAEPELEYLWDCFAETVTIQISNSSDYSSTATYTDMTITLVDEDDSSNSVSAEATDGADEIVVEDVSADSTYTISVAAEWDSTIVTNPSFDEDLGSVTTYSEKNVATDAYSYCNSDVYSYLDYPMTAESFDPENGGNAGIWYKEASADAMMMMMGGGSSEPSYIYFTATPTDTTDGSLYTYDVSIAEESGTLSISVDWFSDTEAEPLTGTLEIYDDGTFNMSIDLKYLGEHAESGMTAYVVASNIDGKWTENDDGTLTLAYDHSSVEVTDTGEE